VLPAVSLTDMTPSPSHSQPVSVIEETAHVFSAPCAKPGEAVVAVLKRFIARGRFVS
jgi:hypothetical protein